MRCKYCKGQEFNEISFNYYECRFCGKLNYVEKVEKKKSEALHDIYLAIGSGAVLMIIVVLILLYVTAVSKRAKIHPVLVKPAVTTEKKQHHDTPAVP